MSIFTTWPDLVPIQTGAPAQIRAADRSSGTPAVLTSRYMASVDHTGLLRRSARCSVTTQHARMQQRPHFASPLKWLLNGSSRATPGLGKPLNEPDRDHDEGSDLGHPPPVPSVLARSTRRAPDPPPKPSPAPPAGQRDLLRAGIIANLHPPLWP